LQVPVTDQELAGEPLGVTMSLGDAAGLMTGLLSRGAALAPSTAGLLLPPPQAATRALAPKAIAISVLRMGMYLACSWEMRPGRPAGPAPVRR
jgi:hypothetical protein